MSFLTRLMGTTPCRRSSDTPSAPDEHAMKIALEDAKEKNRNAARTLAEIADRQARDADLVKQVIRDILERADHTKPKPAGKVIG